MGKLYDRLQKQLKTEYKQDAEDCLKIYNHLKETTGHVWDSQWRILVDTIFKGFPSDERRLKPTSIGYIFLKGLKTYIMKSNIAKHWNNKARELGKTPPFPPSMEESTSNYKVITPEGSIISVEEYMKTDDYYERLEKVVADFMTNEKEKEILALFKPKKKRK